MDEFNQLSDKHVTSYCLAKSSNIYLSWRKYFLCDSKICHNSLAITKSVITATNSPFYLFTFIMANLIYLEQVRCCCCISSGLRSCVMFMKSFSIKIFEPFRALPLTASSLFQSFRYFYEYSKFFGFLECITFFSVILILFFVLVLQHSAPILIIVIEKTYLYCKKEYLHLAFAVR